MTYSLTERKRIRKSFAKRATVQKVPFLIATQLESYTGFLQAHVDRKSTRLNSSHIQKSRMPSSA